MSQNITFREESSLPFKLLVPQDAEWVKSALAKSAEFARSGNISDAHFKATAYAVAAVGASFFNAFTYLLRGMKDACMDIVHLDFYKAAIDFSSDLLKGVQSLFLTAFGIFYVAAGLFFPAAVFQLFEVVRLPLQPEASTGVDEAARQRLDAALTEIEALMRQREEREAEVRELNQVSQQRIAQLEQQLQQKTQAFSHVQQQLLDLGAIRIQDVQRLNGNLEFFKASYNMSVAQTELLANQKAQLGQQLLQKESQINDLQQQLNQAPLPCQINHEALQAQLDELTNKKAHFEQALSEKDIQINALKDQQTLELPVLKAQLQLLTDQKQKLVDQENELKKQLIDSSGDFIMQLEQANKDKQELLKKLESSKNEKADLKTKYDQLDKDFDDLSKRHITDLSNLEGERDDLLNDKQKLETELVEKKEKIESLLEEIIRVSQDNPMDQDAQAALQEAQTRVQDLEVQLNQLKADKAELSEKLKKENTALKQLQIQKNPKFIQLQIQKYENDRVVFLNSIRETEKEFKKLLQIEANKFKKSLDALQTEKEQLIEEKNQLETEIKSLQSLVQKEANGSEQSIEAFKNLMEILREGYRGKVQLSVNVNGEIVSFVFDLMSHSDVETLLHQMLRVASLGVSNLKKAEDLLTSSIFEELDLHASGGIEKPKIEKLYDTDHPTKLQKFNIALDNYVKALADNGIDIEKVFESACQMRQSNQLYADFGYMVHVLKDAIDYMVPPTYTNARERYKVFVEYLRRVIGKMPKEPEGEDLLFIQRVVYEICIARWAGSQMGSYLEGIADMATGLSSRDEIPDLNATQLSEVLEKEIRLIDKLPSNTLTLPTTLYTEKFYGAVGQKDYTGGENIPNVLQNEKYLNPQGEAFEVVYLRHATPNMPGNALSQTTGALMRAVGLGAWAPESGEIIAPDYQTFLKAAQARNEAIVFCSHQRRNDPHAIENEGGRVEEIRKLEAQHPNIFVFVQSVEGELFKNSEGIKSFDSLKKKLENSFYDPASANALPGFVSFPETELKELDKDLIDKLKSEKDLMGPSSNAAMNAWANYLSGGQNCPPNFSKAVEQLRRYRHYRFEVLPKLLNDAHGIFFANKENFSEGEKGLEEWQSFILAFYLLQKMDMKFLVQEFSGASKIYYTTPCKDFIDRGGNMAFCEGRLLDYILGQENDLEILRLRRANLLGPALMARKTAPYMKRVDIGLKFNERLRDLNIIQMNRLKQVLGAGKIISVKGEFLQNQPIMPQTIQLAKTPDEVTTVLKGLLSADAQKKRQMLPQTIFTASKCMVSEEGDIRPDVIKHQMERDMINGIFTVNGAQVLNPDALFQKIKNISLLGNAEIHKMMAFIQQGSQAEPTQFFIDKFVDPAKDIQVFQDTDVKNKYEVTVGLGGATKKIYISPMGFVIKCSNEQSPFYNQGKIYAKIEAEMEIDFVKKRAVLLWRISEVIPFIKNNV